MTKKTRILSRRENDALSKVSKSLLLYLRKSGRSLPWRGSRVSPYQVWVSEIMLQQTQVSRVISYYKKFLKKFPRVQDLASASWEEFLPHYAGLGYYRRGRNMIACAKMVVEKYGGKFPRDFEALRSLPGVGPYTAAAILSFGCGENVLAPDTNMQRVFGRVLHGTKTAKVDFEKVSRAVAPNKKALNAAVMDFGNDVCVKRPRCDVCPLAKNCKYFKTKGRLEVSTKKVREHFPTKDAKVYLWLHENHKEYFSKNPDDFEVFVLDAAQSSREAIKNYFRETYNLDLAVRPPHKKTFIDGKPVMFVNAQILLGSHSFGIFKKSDIENFYNTGEVQ